MNMMDMHWTETMKIKKNQKEEEERRKKYIRDSIEYLFSHLLMLQMYFLLYAVCQDVRVNKDRLEYNTLKQEARLKHLPRGC